MRVLEPFGAGIVEVGQRAVSQVGRAGIVFTHPPLTDASGVAALGDAIGVALTGDADSVASGLTGVAPKTASTGVAQTGVPPGVASGVPGIPGSGVAGSGSIPISIRPRSVSNQSAQRFVRSCPDVVSKAVRKSSGLATPKRMVSA